MGLHPAGDVDRVSPQVIDEPSHPDDAGDDRTRVDADAQTERMLFSAVDFRNAVEHVQSHLCDGLGMVGAGSRKAAHGHVGIAHGLDLFEAVSFGKLVEYREYLVQGSDQFRGGHPGG